MLRADIDGLYLIIFSKNSKKNIFLKDPLKKIRA